jgi:DNA-binding transcriptional ArsR family regulator
MQSATVFRALADPTRRAILDLLRDEPRTVVRIAAGFDVSRPAISQHLRILREAKLVRERQEGRCRYYTLQPAPLAAVDEWLAAYRVSWQRSLLGLKEYVEAARRVGGRKRGRRPDGTDQRAEPPRESTRGKSEKAAGRRRV